MPSKTDFQRVRDQVADLVERLDALDQSGALFEANLTLAMDMAKSVVAMGRDAMVRLSKVEAERSDRLYQTNNLRQGLKSTLDWLDANEEITPRGRA